MTWTMASPRSTSTHSPLSPPSTLTTWPPADLTFSATLEASERVWRLDVPLATITRSNRSDRCEVLKTSMSWALTSSSASTTSRCSFLMSMDPCVQLVGKNIIAHGRGQALPGGPVLPERERTPDLRGRAVDRPHGKLEHGAGRVRPHRVDGAGMTLQEPLHGRFERTGRAGALRVGDVGQRGQFLPALPGV